ncbi:MAG: ABC transporter ATP-binding protein [Thermogemmata sp.]|nr:ABC transporter ATP-binding protein [Thermogemmata sp.]
MAPDFPLLRFEEVSKWYGPVLALNQVCWEFSGGIVGLVGANGAGKSTFLRLAAGQIRPTLGSVTVAGREAWDWRSRRLIGYCPAADAFFYDLTGREFVYVMARLCGFSARQAHKATAAVLERLHMTTFAHRPIYGYSRGMRQKVKLAQALVHQPPLLILDEPLAGIDPLGRHELIQLFRELHQQGHALLISSHELEALEQLTDSVLILSQGRVAAAGTIRDIRAQLQAWPITVRIDVDAPRQLARHLIEWSEVLAIEWPAAASPQHFPSSSPFTTDTLLVRICNPAVFFTRLTQLLAQGHWNVRHLEPLDESAHALLGYLLGGPGKT